MKLSAYLDAQNLKRSVFAKRIGMSSSYVTMICQGRVWPSRDVVAKITDATAGAVTANDFVEVAV